MTVALEGLLDACTEQIIRVPMGDVDVARAREIELQAWKRRSVVHKLKDHAAYLINELL